MRERKNKKKFNFASQISSFFILLIMMPTNVFAAGINDGTDNGASQSTLVRAANGVQTLSIVLIVIVAISILVFYLWYKNGGRKRRK